MKKFIYALLFGTAFGFILQKGGVAKYHILEGQLLLVDFTVMKVMLTAILVGMIGVRWLQKKDVAQPNIKSAQLGANIIGGLIFGTGFALSGYCPGTGAAALGQGNLNALYYMGGMLVGSYVFAEISGSLSRTVKTWGDLGKVTLPDIFHMKEKYFYPLFGLILVVVLMVISRL
jgi:uncharacterized protein